MLGFRGLNMFHILKTSLNVAPLIGYCDLTNDNEIPAIQGVRPLVTWPGIGCLTAAQVIQSNLGHAAPETTVPLSAKARHCDGMWPLLENAQTELIERWKIGKVDILVTTWAC